MKRRRLLVLLTIFLISGCRGGLPHVSSSNTPSSSSLVSSLTDSSAHEHSSSYEEDSTSVSSLSPSDLLTADQITADLIGHEVAFKGAYISYFADGGTEHVGVFADLTGIVFVRYSIVQSEKMRDDTSYLIQGTLAQGASHLEVVSPTLTTTATVSYDLGAIALTVDSIADIYEIIKPLTLSNKGTTFTQVVNFKAQYMLKTDNTLMLVSDGDNFISIHGDNKVNNGKTIGHWYDFIGLVGVYQYKPSIEYYSHQFLYEAPKPTSYPDAVEIEAARDFYTLSVDREGYRYFPYPLSFTGYVRVNASDQWVLADNLTDRIKWQNGDINVKALTIRNDPPLNSELDLKLANAYTNETVESFIVVLYAYLPSPHTWSVDIIL